MFEDYLNDFCDAKGLDFREIWASFFTPKKIGFFMNSLKISRAELDKKLLELGCEFTEILPNFFICNAENKDILSHNNLFNDGKIYIQNPSSYLAPINLGISSTDYILDMCASPGGKSIAIATKLSAMSNLAAIEANRERFFTLKANLKKFGCESVRTYNKDARSVAFTCKERFDRILLDAPCSGYAKFSSEFKEKTPKEIKNLSRLQKQLLNSALTALKTGGEMIYSTCTFFESENEEVIENAMNSKFKIEILPLEFLPVNSLTTPLGTRILPNEIYDGFFLAKLKKLR